MRSGQESEELSLRDIWGLLRRNKWLILLCLVGMTGAAMAYTARKIPLWKSEVVLRIDEETSSLPVMDILQTMSRGSEVETEMEVLRSRTLAEEVVDSLYLQLTLVEPTRVARAALMSRIHVERWAPSATYRLDQGPDGDFSISDGQNRDALGRIGIGQPAALPGVTFRLEPEALDHQTIIVNVRPFDRAVARLETLRSVSRPNRAAGIVTVGYMSTDTQLVKAVPNQLARAFIRQRRTLQRSEATNTVSFLEEQSDTLAIRLATAEAALVAFREEGQVVSISAEGAAQVTQLARLQAERNQMDAEREALQELVDQIDGEAALVNPEDNSPYRMLIAFPPLYANGATSELLRSLNVVDNERSQLLQRRTLEDPDVINLTGRMRDLETQLQSIANTYLQGLGNQVESLDRTLASFGTQLEAIPGKEIQLARLERDEEILAQLFTLLQTRLQEAQIAEAVTDVGIHVIDGAILPSGPLRPRPLLNIILGIGAGLMLGVSLSFMREMLDETIHTKEQAQSAAGGVPVMGMIPRIQMRRGLRNGRAQREASSNGVAHLGERLVTGRDPRSPVSEAYRSLRTNITFIRPDDPPKSIVFTSALPEDGKSTTSANLAITLVQQGARVLLVDADLRRGVLNTVFDLPRAPGLTEILAHRNSLDEGIQRVTVGKNQTLDVLTTGTLPPNPVELLSSKRMRALLDRLEQHYDTVILDCAPLTVVTDAAILGAQAEGVILVARAAKTTKGALRYSADQLSNVRAPVLGVVLNDLDHKRDSRYSSVYGQYGYYYNAYYGEKGQKKKS